MNTVYLLRHWFFNHARKFGFTAIQQRLHDWTRTYYLSKSHPFCKEVLKLEDMEDERD